MALLSVAVLLFALSTLVSGISNDLGKRGLTGDTKCYPSMCIAATVNGSEVEYVLQSTGKRQLGWMALGFGTSMSNAQMVIMWPNDDGTITLSQRTAPGEVMPTVASNPTRVATLSTALSTTSGTEPKLVFTIPANSDKSQALICAFGTHNPGDKSEDATILEHQDIGAFRLDLTKPIAETSTSVASPAQTSTSSSGSNKSNKGSKEATDDIPLLPYQRLIIAHAIFCVVGFLLFLPAGALLARYLRTFTPTWFAGHWIAQFAVSAPTIILGVVLGIKAVDKAGATHLNDDHKKWGIAIFVLYFVQCALGAVIHWIKPKNRTGRPAQNYIHAVLGLLIIALGLYQVRTGYKNEWPKTTGRGEIMTGASVVWYIWVVLLPVLYFAGLALLPRQFRQERHTVIAKTEDEDDGYNMSTVQREEEYHDYGPGSSTLHITTSS